MKSILVIGSAVADVVIQLDHLPARSEDVHVKHQEMCLGGCAMNSFDTIRHFPVPSIPFFPVGTGAYADFVRNAMKNRGICSPIPTPQSDNGCCYCFIEDDGERTFISYHGAEYRFYPEWFALLDLNSIDSVYICGLEIEEETGEHIVSFLERNPHLTIYFAPGPRLVKIRPELMDRLFGLHPIIHLNDEEICAFTGAETWKAAADKLAKRTGNAVIVTLGKDGSYCLNGCDEYLVPGEKVTQIDTNGAGDSHIGAVIAARKLGLTWPQALTLANKVSAAVIGVQGATMPEETWSSLLPSLL